MMHLARGKALMDGLAAAHFRRQASSPHAHENAQLGAARQAAVSSAQLSSPHWQFLGQVAVEQSGRSVASSLPLHLEMMHLARGKALMDGLAAAHFKRHASSPHPHANAQSWEDAQLG